MCSFWQTDQSQNFVLLCVVYELPAKQTPEFHWVTPWGYIRAMDQFLVH